MSLLFLRFRVLGPRVAVFGAAGGVSLDDGDVAEATDAVAADAAPEVGMFLDAAWLAA